MNAKKNCRHDPGGHTGKDREPGLSAAGRRRSRRDFIKALMAAAVWASFGTRMAFALRICGRCGHEALDEAATVCGHCGAPLPPVAPTEPAPDTAGPATEPETRPFTSAARWAARQEQEALTLAEQERWVGVLLYARNARALYAVAEAADAEQLHELARHVAIAREQMERVSVECPVCEGTGLFRTRTTTLQGDTIEQDVPGRVCRLCRGRQSLPGRRPSADVQRILVAGERVFTQEQQRLGLEQRWGVWLPADALDSMTPRHQATLLRAFDGVCESCRGLGHLGCLRCQGLGKLRCANTACLHGVETCPDCEGRGRAQGRRCTSCNGTGRRECADCEGQGFTDCPDCEGRGNRLCGTCRGTGYPATCTRCEGEGTVACTRCRGAGTLRGESCTHCRGEGIILCTACRGYGRRRR